MNIVVVRRTLLIVVVVLLITCVTINAFFHPFNTDEFQHLHIAWYLKEGFRLYVDCVDHHGPLFPILNASLWNVFGLSDSARTFLVFRGISLIYFFLMLKATFLLSRKLFSLKIAILSVLILTLNVTFIIKGIEIRPDSLQVYASLMAIYFLCCNEKTNVRGGVFWFVALFLNLKMLLPFALFLVIYFTFNREKYRELAVVLLVTILCYSIWLVYAYYSGILQSYLLYGVQKNFSFIQNHIDYGKLTFPFWSNAWLSFLVVALLGVGACFFMKTSRVSRIEKRNVAFLATYSFGLFLTILVLRVHEQWSLMYLPVFAIIASCLIYHFWQSLRQRKIVLFVYAFLILSLGHLVIYSSDIILVHNNKTQLKKTDYLLTQTTKSDRAIFFKDDRSQGAYVFRKHYFHKWVRKSRLFVKQPESLLRNDFKMVESLENDRLNVVVFSCLNHLGKFPMTRAYLREHFIQDQSEQCFFRSREVKIKK